MKRLIFIFIISLMLLSCPIRDDRRLHISPGLYNLSGINTTFDDYNAAPPPSFYFSQNIIYSTNSGTEGDNFDIWEASIEFLIDYPGGMNDADKTVTLTESDIQNARIGPYLDGLYNSDQNEYGPYILDTCTRFIRGYYNPSEVLTDENLLYLFGSNRPNGDNFDIYFINQSGDPLSQFCGNSNDDDFYPTYHKNTGALYFSSNRDGDYDIFAYVNSSGTPIGDFLGSSCTPSDFSKPDILNSSSDEKCPYIVDDIMVFVSDRTGSGDIYYSQYRDGGWTTPVSMDAVYASINTSFEEYRPALFTAYYDSRTDDNKILIFSSNRDGGMGGFDLYLCILPAGACE
jgi:hypothetical protein